VFAGASLRASTTRVPRPPFRQHPVLCAPVMKSVNKLSEGRVEDAEIASR
jgi:hypothetical protein